MQRIKILPLQSWLISFLATRQLEIVGDDPTIIHYFGDNKKEILKLREIDEPDLIVFHMKIDVSTKSSSQFLNQFKNWIIDPSQSISDIQNKTNKIWTNNFKIAQIYYQRLGVQRTIVELNLIPESKQKTVSKFSFNNLKDSYKYFCRFMKWQ